MSKDSSYPSNILPSSQSWAQLTVSNMNGDRRNRGFKLILLVVSHATASYLADHSDSGILRILAMSSSLPQQTASARSRRPGTSLLVSPSGHESSTGDLPALSSRESVSSSVSISTSFGAPESRYLLLDHENGHVVTPPVREPIFECPFNFLDCNNTSTDQDEWIEHSLTHFKEVGPPTSNQCPHCLNRFVVVNSPIESWGRRMTCVSSHYEWGQRIRSTKPDSHLIRYLWENSLMDQAQYRNLRFRSESPTAPYTVTESRRSRPRVRWNPQKTRGR